ncbi:hypothetical protein EJO66_08085 [Variovorax beijingensis]|uniref:Flagellar hook-length control protein FliK n=1 Tax=Variovorax beijingensis TaxID=2496117 RepID=A0ABY0A979_9BURK|nr:hypothetical protein [Variovorax beijingensis]RSZ40090.1 hypothetical protein EJO66_08085 [Variovorax beijingensis]
MTPADNIAAPSGTALSARRNMPQAAATGDEAAQRQLAWQREMERAQLAGWFKPGAADTQEASAPASKRPQQSPQDKSREQHREKSHGPAQEKTLPPALGVSVAALRPALQGSPWMSLNGETVAGLPAQGPGARALVERQPVPEFDSAAESRLRLGVRTFERLAPHAAAASAPEAAASQDEAADAAAAPQAAAETLLAPLRLHEETRLRGQAVWIAMRADDQTLVSMLPRLVSDLERGMRERGQRLHQVVCNGRLVWRDGVAMPGDSHSSTFDSIDPKEA